MWSCEVRCEGGVWVVGESTEAPARHCCVERPHWGDVMYAFVTFETKNTSFFPLDLKLDYIHVSP